MSRFRITTFPDGPIAPPLAFGPGWGAEIRELPGAGEVLIHTFPEKVGAPVPLPNEWVLRELPRIDLEEAEGFARLTQQYGPLLDLVLYRTSPMSTDPDFVNAFLAPQNRARAVAKAAGLDPALVTSVDFLRQHFLLLRALVDHVVAYQQRKKLTAAWKAIEVTTYNDPGHVPWAMFEDTINGALQPITMRVVTGFAAPPSDPPLYSIAATQVFNLLVEGLPVRDCKKCSRRFVRRQGGAEHGQNWTTSGVMYCSKSCARAAAQAQYRARKKEKAG